MQNSILIDLVENLTTKECRRFREFIHSPYHNKNEKLRKLGDLIFKYQPNFQDPELSKTRVYPQIFGHHSPYNELKINNLISDLLQLLYTFLAQEVYQQKELLQRKYLIGVLSKKDADRHIEKNLKKYQNKLEQQAHRSYDYFLEAYHYYEEENHQQLKRSMRSNEGHLQKQSDALDTFYHINKFRIACEMTSRNIVAQAGYQCHYIDDLLRWYETGQSNMVQHPALQLYYKVLQMLLHQEEEKWFEEVRIILKEQYQYIPREELWPIYSFALNFCIIKINSGQSTYYQETLQLYKELLDREIIFVNGYLTQWSFKNIITTGIRLQEFDWTDQFIQDYQNSLLPEEKENAIVYNLAALYQAKGDYTKALQLLHDVDFTDTSYHLGAKTIQLKSYYELNETEALLALIEAFRKYLMRNRQISTYRKNANNNMLKLLRKIYQLQLKKEVLVSTNFNRRYKSIRQQLKTLQPLANKDWLIDIFSKIKLKTP